jgi:hypothetical protein
MTWNYFASYHAKGEVDGVGTMSKIKIQVSEAKCLKLQIACEVVSYLKT